MTSFGKRLRYLRKNKKLTQKELSAKLKISESAISMYERDVRQPSYEILNQIVDEFETTSGFLLRGHNEDPYTENEKELTKDILTNMKIEDIKQKYDIDITDLTDEEWRGIVAYVRAAKSMKKE